MSPAPGRIRARREKPYGKSGVPEVLDFRCISSCPSQSLILSSKNDNRSSQMVADAHTGRPVEIVDFQKSPGQDRQKYWSEVPLAEQWIAMFRTLPDVNHITLVVDADDHLGLSNEGVCCVETPPKNT